VKAKRMRAEARKDDIRKAALPAAERDGLQALTRRTVAELAGVAEATVSFHFGTMQQFRRDMMRYAVACESVQLVAWGLAVGESAARKAPPELQERALARLRGA